MNVGSLNLFKTETKNEKEFNLNSATRADFGSVAQLACLQLADLAHPAVAARGRHRGP
jgi:hypothetical protein